MAMRSKTILLYTLTASLAALTVSHQANSATEPEMGKELMQKQMQMMKPELQAKMKALKPETRQLLQRVTSQHTVRSNKATMRQVMQEVLASYQGMVAGIVTDNGEMAADYALQLANHRIPRGGMVPYLAMEDINDGKLGALADFNEKVEGSARQLAEAATSGDMIGASSYLSQIAVGCVGCHQMFRGIPGVSPWLR